MDAPRTDHGFVRSLPHRLWVIVSTPGALILVLILLSVAIWVRALIGSGGKIQVSLPADASIARLPENVRVAEGGAVWLEIDQLSWWLRLETTLPLTVSLLLFAFLVWLSTPILTALRQGRPFSGSASSRLTYLGVIVILATFLSPMMDSLLAGHIIATVPGLADASVTSDILGSGTGLIVGYLLIVLSRAAAIGAHAERELQGLV
jgi:hypothetical protein